MVIKSHVPSRLALTIVKAVNRLGKDVFSFAEVKNKINEGESEVKKHFKKLLSLGTLMPVGGGMYNYGVSRPVRAKINALLSAFDAQNTHSKVVKMLLDAEHF